MRWGEKSSLDITEAGPVHAGIPARFHPGHSRFLSSRKSARELCVKKKTVAACS
jgi:hypothetical protein